MELKIDKQFNELLPPLTRDEYSQLEANIIVDGCRDPLVVWGDTLIDGHHRYVICQEHGIEFSTVQRDFPSRLEAEIWILTNQKGRRSLSPPQKGQIAIALKRRLNELGKQKMSKGGSKSRPGNAEKEGSIDSQEPSGKCLDAWKESAKAVGMSTQTLSRYEEIQEKGDDETKRQVDNQEISIAEGHRLVKEKRATETTATFNETTEKVDWAVWTWNPYTGCLGPDGKGCCEYCYARDIAERWYGEEKFAPTFRPERLAAPFNTSIPKRLEGKPGVHNVFLCSMGDLFGEWVEQEHIDRILESIRRAEKESKRKNPKIPPWTFIVLTKNPARLATIDWPDNCWVGTTVDVQKRVTPALRAFREVNAKVKFVSCEPLLEPVTFHKPAFGNSLMEVFDWIIIGGRSKNSKLPAFQPEWAWVESLLFQARKAGCKVYFKPNLTAVPKEYPE